MLIPVERLDTLFLAGGGRMRAFLTEETPARVIVRLVDGTERRFGPGEIEAIAYSDGTSSAVKPRR